MAAVKRIVQLANDLKRRLTSKIIIITYTPNNITPIIMLQRNTASRGFLSLERVITDVRDLHNHSTAARTRRASYH